MLFTVFIHGEIEQPVTRYLEDDEPELAQALQLAIEEEKIDDQLAQMMDIDYLQQQEVIANDNYVEEDLLN